MQQFQSHLGIRAAMLLAVFLVLVYLPGCQEGNIGSRLFPLQITTTPQDGADAYLIPNDVWVEKNISPHDKDFAQFIDRYKITEGKTPVTVRYHPYAYKVVVKYNGKFYPANDLVVPGDVSNVNINME